MSACTRGDSKSIRPVAVVYFCGCVPRANLVYGNLSDREKTKSGKHELG